MKINATRYAWQPNEVNGDEKLSSRSDSWDRQARGFSDYEASTEYSDAFIRIMRLRKTWTVLDLACGDGAIVIPLAGRVRRITAADSSGDMLDIVRRRCCEKGIANVNTVHSRWEDDWASPDIGMHDVVIASRWIDNGMAAACINKLCKVARKAVYISTVVGSGPFDRLLYEATGRELKVEHDFIYYYDLLDKMGMRANVDFISETHRNEWATLEEALDGQRWMFRDGLTEEEEQRVKSYLERHLERIGNRWRLPYQRQCHWAVMWWTNEA